VVRSALAREEVLDRGECLRLLGTRRLGRVAVAVEGWSPLIRPGDLAHVEALVGGSPAPDPGRGGGPLIGGRPGATVVEA
jgi:hypothetical protein